MSGVWVFKNNGVIRLVENPHGDNNNQGAGSDQPRMRKKILVYLRSGQVITSYRMLEEILRDLGWETYYGGDNRELIQYHKRSSIDLISLPRDFAKFSSVYMYDIVVKNPNVFQVRDL